MDVILHIVSYATPTALLTVGLAPSLLPTAFKPLPIILLGLFSAVIPHFYPAPNSNDLFMFSHWIMWSLSCIWLIVLHEWCGILLNINLTGIVQRSLTSLSYLATHHEWSSFLHCQP